MALIDSIRRVILPEEELFDFASYSFKDLDVDAVADDLRIEIRAEENGKHELPFTDDIESDAPEKDIVAFIQNLVVQIKTAVNLRLLEADEVIGSAPGVKDIPTVKTLSGKGKGDLLALLDVLKSRLGRAAENVKTAVSNLENFKRQNGIEREADYS